VGEVVTAAQLNTEIRDQFNSMFAAWTTYSPIWTASTTNPSLGNGTLTGRHMKIGRTVITHINQTMGSTTTYGSGNYNWTIPFQAANAGATYVGSAQLLGTARWGGQTVISPNASTLSAHFPRATTDTRIDFMHATRPETLADTAQLRMTFVYEAAA
jgi:hypothetical protein